MKVVWVVAAALAIAPVARAQDVSDLQPPPPAVPAGQAGSVYMPGMPIPQPPPPQNMDESSAAKHSVKKESSGLVIYDDGDPDFEADQTTAISGPAPETYTVRKGDTLWGVSSQYFRNPWAWPKLWSYNPSITNPHWIYPGDILRLAPPGEHQAPIQPAAVQPQREPDHQRRISRMHPLPDAVYLRQHGFVEPDELRDSGKLVGSKEEKMMLATLDEAYVEFPANKPLEIGGRYIVYKSIREVNHPVTNKRLGDVVQIFGEVEVKSVTPSHIARVLITDSYDAIERGARVGPLRTRFRVADPKQAASDLSGVVVATLQPLVLIGAQMLAFLDKGKLDGVEVGNVFRVVRRGDGYQPLLAKPGPVDDQRFPREDFGEILVLDLRDHLATGLVLRSVGEVRIGDRVEAKAGY